jgi:hypothetical protein
VFDAFVDELLSIVGQRPHKRTGASLHTETMTFLASLTKSAYATAEVYVTDRGSDL